MVGIYSIIRPLSYLGITPERFTARLFLTLHYIEAKVESRIQAKQRQSGLEGGQSIWQHMMDFRSEFVDEPAITEVMSLEVPRLGLLDYVYIALFLVLLGFYR